MPDFTYVCAGFFSVEVDPSPNVQAHEVGELVDLSVNWTGNGFPPSLADAEKSAFGATFPDFWRVIMTSVVCPGTTEIF